MAETDTTEVENAGLDNDMGDDGRRIGLNVNAPVFVPSFVQNTDKPEAGDTLHESSNTGLNGNIAEKGESTHTELDDDWEAAADTDEAEGSRRTSEEEENDDDGGDAANDTHLPKQKKVKPMAIVPDVRKDHINVVFIGHVDAGKSTIGGQIMYLTGMVEKRTLEKYEREAKEKNRESWYLSWALDTNQEERDKGKTVEVGRAFFETEDKHFTILDAPGHKSFVPNMICGASQADLAVLVISARKGEFETGFERGGQTREHAMLVKTAGVRHLIILINKMDDPTVKWSEERYSECKEKIIPYLKRCGFNVKADIFFIPCSGLTGAFLKDPPGDDVCSWYSGPCFIEYINKMEPMDRRNDGPVRLPIVDRYKDMGTLVLGKLESGSLEKNQQLILMPNKNPVEALQIWSDDYEVTKVMSGENVKVKLKGIEEDDVTQGFVLCTPTDLCTVAKVFDAQVVILEHKSIICAGYSAILHLHTAVEEATIKKLICLIDKKTGDKYNINPRFIKQDQIAIVRIECSEITCLEPFNTYPQLGRFTLRDEGRTIAIGKVLKVVE